MHITCVSSSRKTCSFDHNSPVVLFTASDYPFPIYKLDWRMQPEKNKHRLYRYLSHFGINSFFFMCLGHKWIPANRELFFLNVGLNMKR